MKTTLIEESKGNQTAYNSLMVKPRDIGVICSDLSLKIINELVKTPCCAMDVARKLEQHEQKIYYHLRRLENVGIIKLIANEKRYGMTAKIYDVVSPVIAAKLYNDGYSIKNSAPAQNPEITKFLHPFIVDGKLNAKIIIGDPYPHGEYDRGSLDGCYVSDLTLFLGNIISKLDLPCYKLDIHVTDEDIKNNNLIIIGSIQGNVVAKKVNEKLSSVYFDKKSNYIVSKLSNKTYNDPLAGIVLKTTNPFNKNKSIILLAGRRSRGTVASIIAFTQNLNEIMKGNHEKPEKIAKIVHGFDRDGNGIIDSVKFLE